MLAAELPGGAPPLPEGRPGGAPGMAAPLRRVGLAHALLRVAAAELGLLAPRHPVRREGGAAFVPAPPADDVRHAVLSAVPGAEERRLRAGLSVGGHLDAPLRTAPGGRVDLHHALPGVLLAELALLAVGLAVRAGRGAARMAAALTGTLANVGHPLQGVIRAHGGLFSRGSERPRRDAAVVAALLVVEVDHPLGGVLHAELALAAYADLADVRDAERRLLGAGGEPAPLGDDIDHSVLRVLRAHPSFLRPVHAEGRLLFTAFALASSPVEMGHPRQTMVRAKHRASP